MTPTEHPAKTPSTKTGRFATLGGLLRGRGSGAPSSRPVLGTGALALRLLAPLALATAALLALSATPASAAETHVFTPPPIGEAGTGNGQFELTEQSGLAINQGSGDFYLADTGNGRVEQFEADGTFLRTFGSFTTPTFIAVDNSGGSSAGDVYVADSATSSVSKFDAAGNLISSWGNAGQVDGSTTTGGAFGELDGIAVDASGNLFVLSGETRMSTFEGDGTFGEEFNLAFPAKPRGFALDNSAGPSSGDIYTFYAFGPETLKFGPDGGLLGEPDLAGGTGLAVDPATGDLYVDHGSEISRYDASGAPIETFGGSEPAGGGLSSAAALALDSSHDVYVANLGAAAITLFAAVHIPIATTGEATEVEATAATLNGEVNSSGVELEAGLAGCRFEWGETTAYGHEAPCDKSAAEIGSGQEFVSLSTEITGLTAGAIYHYRILAANPNGKSPGADETLETPPPPSIDTAEATNLSPTSADLHAEVNPRGSQTTCQIEYGETSEPGNPDIPYEQALPCVPADLGSGNSDVSVTRHLTGLAPNTTYHWRVIATNPSGTTTGLEHTFIYPTEPPGSAPGSCSQNEALRTGPSAALPDCRAYELVTSASKNSALLELSLAQTASHPMIARDGQSMIAPSIQCFAGAQSCVALRFSEGQPYEFTRIGDGWMTRPLAPPAPSFEFNTWLSINADAGTALFSVPIAPQSEVDAFYAGNRDGSFVPIGPVGEHANFASLNQEGFLSTGDLSHLVYETQEPVWPFDTGDHLSTYEYVGTGNASPLLVGASGGQGSTALISTCGTLVGRGGGGGGGVRGRYGSLSEDGRTVYFTAEGRSDSTSCAQHSASEAPPAAQLWARVDGERSDARSALISGPTPGVCTSEECQETTTEEVAARYAAFEGASTDGSRVFFTSTQQLTDDASQDSFEGDTAKECFGTVAGFSGCNLYMSECTPHCDELTAIEEADQRHLVDVSAGAKSSGGPRVQGIVAVSADGSHVYFVAKGVITGDEENQNHKTAEDEADNLYAFSEGHVTFITTLSQSDERQWRWGALVANVTPDGRFLAFTSHRALTPDVTREEGPAQVYQYDAQTEGLTRISIGEGGFNDNGNAGTGDASIVPVEYGTATGSVPVRSNPTMSDDGAFVFFQSPVALAPGALNDVPIGGLLAENVYEYHKGHVSLISDGKDTSPEGKLSYTPTELLGSDVTGASVFFATFDQLVPQDTDTQRDYYDARIGGGFPESPQPTPCQGDSCKGKGTEAGSPQSPGTPNFNGPEEGVKHPRHPKKSHHRHTHHKRHAHKKNGPAKRNGDNYGGRR